MPENSPPLEYHLTDQARFGMERRGISESEVTRVLAAPEQADLVRPGRMVYQSRTESGKVYLLRVFVDVDRQPAGIVTAYRTSKVEKYWKSGR